MDQHGWASIEACLLIPLLTLSVVIMGGIWRIGWAQSHLHYSAQAAARAATIPSHQEDTYHFAHAAWESSMDERSLRCLSSTFDMTISDMGDDRKRKAVVKVHCQMSAIEGIPFRLPVSLDSEASEMMGSLREGNDR